MFAHAHCDAMYDYETIAVSHELSYYPSELNRTRGQSNLTKSASRGAHSPVRGHPRGSKFVPLNSWGRGFYYCSIVTIGLGCTVWPQCTRMTTNQRPTTNDVTTKPISISASFTKVSEALKKCFVAFNALLVVQYISNTSIHASRPIAGCCYPKAIVNVM